MFQQDEPIDDQKFENFKNQIRLQQNKEGSIFNIQSGGDAGIGGALAQSRDPKKKKVGGVSGGAGPISISAANSGNVNMIDQHFKTQQQMIENKKIPSTSPRPVKAGAKTFQ
jgi:hypothetical protein